LLRTAPADCSGVLQVPAQNAAYSFFYVAPVVNLSYVFFSLNSTQFSITGRPETLSRGNRWDANLTDSDLPVQATLRATAADNRWSRSRRCQRGVANGVLIPTAGHLSNIEQPEAFNRAVLDCLQRAVSRLA